MSRSRLGLGLLVPAHDRPAGGWSGWDRVGAVAEWGSGCKADLKEHHEKPQV